MNIRQIKQTQFGKLVEKANGNTMILEILCSILKYGGKDIVQKVLI